MIHGTIHRERPSARVLLHCHSPYATVLVTLVEPAMPPIDQNTARFCGDLGIDLDYGGIAEDADEGLELARAFGNYSNPLMGNHGVACVGETVAEAFENLYFLERAAKTLMLALPAAGRSTSCRTRSRKTAEGWRAYAETAQAHFDHLKSQLDRTDPSYREGSIPQIASKVCRAAFKFALARTSDGIQNS